MFGDHAGYCCILREVEQREGGRGGSGLAVCMTFGVQFATPCHSYHRMIFYRNIFGFQYGFAFWNAKNINYAN